MDNICVNPNVKPNFDIAATVRGVQGVTPLMAACSNNNKDSTCALALLKMFVQVDAVDANGWTAAHHACRNGALDALKGLSVAGAQMGLQR